MPDAGVEHAGVDPERARREREAYDEHRVDEVMASWHGRFPHVFAAPNTRWAERRFDELTEAAVRGKRVIDMGCGDGASSSRLLEFGAAHVLGIDVSETTLARARRRAVPGRLDFAVGDVTVELEGVHDVVFGRSILHHLDYRRFLPSVYERNLAPGGTMLFMEPQGSNLLVRTYTRLVAAAHTPDERSFMKEDLAWLRGAFPQIELTPINYLTFPAAVVTSILMARRPNNPLLGMCDLVDRWVADHFPGRHPYFRQTMVVIRKPVG